MSIQLLSKQTEEILEKLPVDEILEFAHKWLPERINLLSREKILESTISLVEKTVSTKQPQSSESFQTFYFGDDSVSLFFTPARMDLSLTEADKIKYSPEISKHFDVDFAHKIMTDMEWEWLGQSVSQDDIIRNMVMLSYKVLDGETKFISTGGFAAIKQEDNLVYIFTPIQATAYNF